MSCSTCKTGCEKKQTHCPLCDTVTHKVATEEVYGMIKESVRPYVHGNLFQLCDNEDCEAVFHSMDSDEIILTQDINKLKLQLEEKRTGSESL